VLLADRTATQYRYDRGYWHYDVRLSV